MSEGGYVLDASALLCLFFREPGAARVEAVMASAAIGAANLAEVIAKLVDRGVDGAAIVADIAELDIEVVAMDRGQAEAAGRLRAATRGAAGLSLGDRCCLALAQRLNATAVTTDRAWGGLEMDIAVEVVR
jgi:PIN domain nuclease of toxin-antitoxin system